MMAKANPHQTPQVSNSRRRNWAYAVLGLAVLLSSLGFYLNAQASNAHANPLAAAYEIQRTEPLTPKGFLGKQTNWLLVEVFDPATGEWKEMTKGEVVPGEEFVGMNLLFKEHIYGWTSEQHGEIDITRLEDAYRAFDPKNERQPTGDDVVYVFGQQLPRTGFRLLSTIKAGETFRFQGRIYKSAEGSNSNILRIIDTGKTLAKAGGDPDPKPLPLILTAQTAHRFPNKPQYQPTALDHKGIANGDSPK